MLVTLIFIAFLLCRVRGLGCVFCLSSFSLVSGTSVLIDPCGRGGVREHPRERTRTDETDPASHPPHEVVQASVGSDGAVRPPWIQRSRSRAERAGAWTR